MRIDAHQHFWKFNAVRDAWITEDMATIRQDFLPPDLAPILQRNAVDGCITVQSDQSEAENDFQLANAAAHAFVRGIVGWVDLRAANAGDRLAYYSRFPLMKGFRHILQGEQDRAMMLQPAFMNGIGMLERYGFSYDILIYPDQLDYSRQLVAAFPNQRFVVDHLAKPAVRDGAMEDWKRGIQAIARHENVWCKLSGMVTEASWKNWKEEDFRPYLDAVVEGFGTKRIMFGSDWPVCLLAADYESVLSLVVNYFSGYSATEQSRIFGSNAAEFYKI